MTVHKTKTDLAVTCTKSGFQDASAIIPAKFNGVTAGNILLGGLVGIGVDAASGANYGYDELTEIPLLPVDSAVTPAEAGQAPPQDGPTQPTS